MTTDSAPQKSAAILATMCLGVFLAQLDSTVAYLGTKAIADDLKSGVSQMQWVLDAYDLTYATFLMTGGALGDIYGRRRVFVIGVALIVAGSLVCAVAPDGATLIAGRALTGLGSALELPTSLAIVTVTFTDAKARGRALGIWASCNGLAMAIGPTVGGFLVDAVGWRSIFFLSVPVGLAAVAMAQWRVPESSHPEGRHLDPVAQALAIVAIGTLSFVTIEGQHLGWTSWPIIATAATIMLAGIAFVRWERDRAGAMVPLDIFGNQGFNAALAIAALMTFGMYAMLFLTPLYLQSVIGSTAFQAGLQLLPLSLAFVIVSNASGALTSKFGLRAMLVGGMACMGGGLLILASLVAAKNIWAVEAALLVIGIGLGLNTGPVNAVAVGAVPPARSGTASGLVNTARMVGATMGIAALGAVYAGYAKGGTPSGMLDGLRFAYLGGGIGELFGGVIAFAFIRDAADHRAITK